MELRKAVQVEILRTIQQSVEPGFNRGLLDKIYGKNVIDNNLKDLIETHLVDGEVIKGISPPSLNFVVRGLTPAGQRSLGIDASGSGIGAE
jgi:hypothetical protein